MAKKTALKLVDNNEREARKNVIEELFYDFNRSKTQIYWVNFQRGIVFGMGSVLGGAVIIALSAALLTYFVDLPAGIGDFIQDILDAMSRRPIDQ